MHGSVQQGGRRTEQPPADDVHRTVAGRPGVRSLAQFQLRRFEPSEEELLLRAIERRLEQRRHRRTIAVEVEVLDGARNGEELEPNDDCEIARGLLRRFV